MSLFPRLRQLHVELTNALNEADEDPATIKRALRKLTKDYVDEFGDAELPTADERLAHAKEWIGSRINDPKHAEMAATLLDGLAFWATMEGVNLGIEAAKRGGRKPSYDHAAIVKAFQRGDSPQQVIECFGVSRSTAFELQKKAYRK